MRLLTALFLVLVSHHAMASKKPMRPLSKIAPIESCFKATDSLEREYCQKKRIKAMNEDFSVNLDKFKETLALNDKNELKNSLNKDIQDNKDLIKLLNDELKAKEENLAKLETIQSSEEKQISDQQEAEKKQKEDIEKVKKALKKIFK